MAHIKEKKKWIETDLGMIQMMELVNRDIKTVIITSSYV